MTTAVVPVIDLGRSDRGALATAIDEALATVGFMAVVGHGVDPALTDRMFALVGELFALPLADKLAIAPSDPGSSRGYAYVGATAQAAAHDAATAADLNETFNAGLDPVPDAPYYREAAAHFPPSVWPVRPAELRDVWREYLVTMQALTDRIMGLMATALGLPADHFARFIDRPMASITANHYPALDETPPPDQFRGGAHTDYGTVTLLATDGVAGLELQDADGTWAPAAPVPGGLHVNTGDMLSFWSGGHWRSTWHRVVPPPGGPPYPERTSIAYFHSPNADAVIAPLPGLATGSFEPLTAGAYLRAKLDKYFARRAVNGPRGRPV